MAVSTFRNALALVLAHEGGFTDHPKDPGGPTNRGITQRVYDAYRKLRGQPAQSVRHIDSRDVEAIYRQQYWRRIRGDDLPAGLDYAVFDFAVNSGVSRAIRYLQRLVKVEDDAVIGAVTLSAILESARQNEEAMIFAYCGNRLAFVKSLSTFPTFGRGWTRRIVGSLPGYQSGDVGVLDCAIDMARKDQVFLMPNLIGFHSDEVKAKAEPLPESKDAFPTMPLAEIADLATVNDKLALKIALKAFA